jgi:hypothetical protein
MSAVNKEEILFEWCLTNPFLTDKTLFNFLHSKNGQSAVAPIAETVAADYCDNTKLVNYDFMWQIMFSVSEETDNTNTDSMFELRKWQDWIDEQNESGNLPDFGGGYDMFEVVNLTGMPDLAQTYENGMGKYQFPARLIYLQKNSTRRN